MAWPVQAELAQGMQSGHLPAHCDPPISPAATPPPQGWALLALEEMTLTTGTAGGLTQAGPIRVTSPDPSLSPEEHLTQAEPRRT